MMTTSDVKVVQLWGVQFDRAPTAELRNKKHGFRVIKPVESGGGMWVTVAEVKTGEVRTFGFNKGSLPGNWTLIEDVP